MSERRPRTANTELVRLLPAQEEALAEARAMVEEVEGLSRAARDDIALLVTELVGNSLRHAGLGPDDQIRVRIARQRGSVRVEVIDPGPGFSPMRERPGRRQTAAAASTSSSRSPTAGAWSGPGRPASGSSSGSATRARGIACARRTTSSPPPISPPCRSRS